MSQTLPRRMTADEFLAWDETQQDCRHELVDGSPVAMTGARQVHDQIVGNIFANIWQQLRGKPCRASTPDVALKMPNGNVRRPDVAVHCPPFDGNARFAAAPVLVVEVLSPSTRSSELARKLSEYLSVSSLRHALLVEPDFPQVTFWWRTEQFWDSTVLEDPDRAVEATDPALRLSLAEIYEAVIFPPRLVP